MDATGEKIDYRELYEQERRARLAAEARLDHLQQQLDQLTRIVFGSKSERFVPKPLQEEQLRMQLGREIIVEIPSQEESDADTPTSAQVDAKPGKPKKKPATRLAIPAELITKRVVLEPEGITEDDTCIGQEETFQFEYTPQQLDGICYIRPIYRKADVPGEPNLDSDIRIAPLPPEVIRNSLAGASFMANITVEKVADHMPIKRQQTALERMGLKIPYSTLMGFYNKACAMLWPLYEVLKQAVLDCGYIQMDETTIKVLNHDGQGSKGSHRGYFWVGAAPPEKIVFFEYQPGRNQEVPQALLENFKGKLQTDGYECYNTLSKRADIELICCMSHARRYFEQSLKNDRARATHALEVFGMLYDIERKYKGSAPEDRLRARQQQATPIWEEFGRWLEDQAGLLAAGSAIHKAFAYTMRRYKRLSRYMDDPIVEIDNNEIERNLRPAALGRRNFLLCGSDQGARRVALLYSLIGTCKLHGINPVTWMTDVLRKIQAHPKDRLAELLPHRWKELNPELAANQPKVIVERILKKKKRTA